MEEKKLNLNAPILSVRKLSIKNELRAKNMRNKEFNIPFTWEQKPGRAKDRNTVTIDEEEEEQESDESLFNCSVSDEKEFDVPFPKKEEVQEFIIDRFIPAAKAMSLPQEDRVPRFRRAAAMELESYIDEEDACYGSSVFSRINLHDGLMPRFRVEVSNHRFLAQPESQDEVPMHRIDQEDTYIREEHGDSETLDKTCYHGQSLDQEKRHDCLPKRDILGRKTLSFDLSEEVQKKHGKVLSLSASIERTLGSALTMDKFVDAATESGSTSSSDQSKYEGKSKKFEGLKKYENSYLLPLPLPKSPSESWLKRTLPSVSSKSSSKLSVSNNHVGW